MTTLVAPREIPILLWPELVRATLEGRKSQTMKGESQRR